MTEPFDPEILKLLERRYAPGEEQKCRGCEGPMRYLRSVGPEVKVYRCASRPEAFESLLAWSRHIEGNDLMTTRKPDREAFALIRAYRELSTSRSETVRKALELAEHLGEILGSDEVFNAVCELRLEQAASRPYQPELRWAPYQEFASNPELETTEPPAGRIAVRATGYRDNYIIIYWTEEES